MQVEMRCLIAWLQIGSSKSKNSTMYWLLDLFSEGDKNVMISVTRGVFPVFMRLLDSNSSVEME